MAIKFGRPIEMRDAPRQPDRRSPARARPRGPPAPQPQGRMGAAAGAGKRRSTTDDLIWPLFVVDGHNARTAVASMPGVDRAQRRPGGARRRARG